MSSPTSAPHLKAPLPAVQLPPLICDRLWKNLQFIYFFKNELLLIATSGATICSIFLSLRQHVGMLYPLVLAIYRLQSTSGFQRVYIKFIKLSIYSIAMPPTFMNLSMVMSHSVCSSGHYLLAQRLLKHGRVSTKR